MCLDHQKLDPIHFHRSPGLARQKLLKTTSECCQHEAKRRDCELSQDEFRLELLKDIDMFLMFENGIRREINQAAKRYAKVNDKHIK